MALNPQIANSLVTGGFDVLGGLIGMASQHSANKANMELAKYNWEQQKQMWHMNNEYNKPSAQMARYLEAGLNPNLIYGSGSASAGNSTSTPTPQMPHVEPLTDGSFMGTAASHAVNAYNAARITDADVDNKNSLTNYNNEKAKTEKLQQDLLTLDWISKDLNNKNSKFDYDIKVETRDSIVNKIIADSIGVQLSNESKRLDNFVASQTAEDRIKITAATLKNTQLMADEIKSRTNLNGWKAREAAATINKISAEIVLINRKSYGQMIENSFNTSTFNDSVGKVSQELTNLIISGDKSGVEAWFKNLGLDKNFGPLVNIVFALIGAAKGGYIHKNDGSF